MTRPVVAAVELGSTSIKLLVAGPDGPRAQATAVTRLGREVDRTGRIGAVGLERTLAALGDFRSLLERHHPEAVRVVATSACRDATNRDDVFDAIAEVLGHRPTLLTGAEEGRLGFLGARAALSELTGPTLVVDIGGGSTEFMIGETEPTGVMSIDVGAGRITERHLHSDPPHPAELSNAIGWALDHVDDVLRDLPAVAEATTIVGLGGTVKVAAAVELGLAEYDPAKVHGFVFPRDAVEDVFRTLATEPLADRIHNPGLPADRAEVIVGGCCVLVAVLRKLNAPGLVVSSHGVLDALVAGLWEERS